MDVGSDPVQILDAELSSLAFPGFLLLISLCGFFFSAQILWLWEEFFWFDVSELCSVILQGERAELKG